eukprot:TRINITY_DN56897_c0_g1_i1.p1 TRINITY_DN56897_c0_g1~~TRINITY_DN56897_c0_g1_i1.p1  ORF type:complete len:237 (-),score=51.60 TRINITY_DN56897_c0_g1_i1:4-714(-)
MCIRDRLYAKLSALIPFVFSLLVVVPIWAWYSEFSQQETHITEYSGVRKLQSQVNDIRRFKIGPSTIHGNGVMTTVRLNKGDTAGIHWFEYQTDRNDRNMALWPWHCTTLPGERELIAQGFNGSAAPTQHLPEEEMLGCFPRAVNHFCHGSTEIHYENAPELLCSQRDGAYLALNSTPCIPDVLSKQLPRRQGSKIRAVYLRAVRDLEPGDEITYNYLTAPDYVSKEAHVTAGCGS